MVPQNRVVKGLDPPCRQLDLWRPPGQFSCLGVLGACTSMPFSGVVSLTSQAFSSCTHGMMGTEVEKGDPALSFPFLLGVLGEGGSLVLFSRVSSFWLLSPLSVASDR